MPPDSPEQSSRAVSIRASREYIKALKVIAAEQDLHVADLVYSAVNTAYGTAVAEKLRFFTGIDYSDCQSTVKTAKSKK